jgi:hypothetical protein
MKKCTVYFVMMVMLLGVFPTQMRAAEVKPNTSEPAKEIPANVQVMLNRLDEIKAMDKSDLTSEEKKELRKETKAIKSAVTANGGGVYLSVGAVILIVLLLIILL